MANVSKLLHGSKDEVDLLARLEPLPDDRKRLREAKQKVRDHLRATFGALGRQLGGQIISPRFFTQGSEAYKTLNRPAHLPPQQMDLDDGTYLPLSFMKNAPRPSVAAEAFFKVVDVALAALGKREGWTFETRPTCARLVIAHDAHVDVPLYAIPDAEFTTLAKAAAALGLLEEESGEINFMDASRSPDSWDLLPSEKVLLAHREEDWKESDPRKIHAWVLASVDLYGEQFRRQCRYLKSWRDHHHPTLKSVSSILLMACAWQVYEDLRRGNMPTRDDLALATITEQLPRLLEGPVCNPTDDGERLDAKLSDPERRDAIAMADALRGLVGGAVHHCFNSEAAVHSLQQAFGPRVPLRPDLVVVESPAAVAAAAVFSKPPAIVPAPEVRRSRSG